MTASTPKGRVEDLALELSRTKFLTDHDFQVAARKAISQAVNESLDEAIRICRAAPVMSYPAHEHPERIEKRILKLKAAYAKGEKGE